MEASQGSNKVGAAKPRQRKGMFIREHVGARRATFTSSCNPIHTTAEVYLYSDLLPKHTRGCRTNFDTMARAYNNEVVHTLHQPQPEGSRAITFAPRQLGTFRLLTGRLPRSSACGGHQA